MTENRINKESISIRSDGDNSLIVGWGAVFGKRSRLIAENGKVFYEVISPGAFTEVLNRSDLNVIANKDHDDTKMLARTRSKTLNLFEDEVGLRYEFVPPNTQLGRDVVEQVNRGDLDESSFRYSVSENNISWSRAEDGYAVRTISKVSSLRDVCLTANGAFGGTDVGLASRGLVEFEELESERKAETERKEIEDLEQKLEAYYINVKNNFYE